MVALGEKNELGISTVFINGFCHLQALDRVHNFVAQSVEGADGQILKSDGAPGYSAAANRHNSGKKGGTKRTQFPGTIASHTVSRKVHP